MLNKEKELVRQAHQILQNNWRGSFTVPTDKLYPFQWNWDSGFVALGLSHVNLSNAISELDTLFSGQWENGMIPHILFHSENESTYFPNHDFWKTEVNTGAPVKPKTSGISQPPVHGFVLEHLLKKYPDDESVEALVKRLFPKVKRSHEFYYKYRDLHGEGLFFLYHPWESGRDNSPIWDEAMDNINIRPGSISSYTRKDLDLSDPAERPTQDQYDRYVYLLELGQKYGYDGTQIAEHSPLLMQDVMMNAILLKSNKALLNIARKFDWETKELESWIARSEIHFDQKFWNTELQTYVSYDLKAGKQIFHHEIGGLVALFAEVPSKEKANQLNAYLMDLSKRGYALCPSYDVDSPLFDSKRYWRGPVWPQMNWMIYQGLKAYGFEETAAILRSDFLDLVMRQGFYEYFEPEKEIASKLSTGYGGNNFSWTAAVVIDFILSP